MPKAMRAGHPTFWQDFGSGPARALALHCSLAHSGAWSGVADVLADAVTMTAFDLPGHGQSGDWDGQEDYGTLTTKIAASFIEEPMHLIGHSFGAVAALRLAQAAPEVVLSLTMIEPVLFAAAKGRPEWDAHVAEIGAFVRAMEAQDRMRAAQEFTTLWGTGTDWEALTPRARDYAADRIHLIPAGAPAIYDDNARTLAPGALEALVMPVMLIRGDRSPSVITAITDELAARLPDVGTADVEGAGHMLPITHPDQTAGLIEVNINR